MIRLAFLFFIINIPATAQITGLWKSIDDRTNELKSVVEIVEKGGMISGKVVQIFPKPGEEPNPLCQKCPKDDSRYRKPILGMEIIQSLQKSGNEYIGGTVLDPEEGKVYRCKIWLEGNTLKLRGYVGPFFRTQTWQRHSTGK
jgi:uncharacterized protein (DUF2147 family)